MQIETSWIDRRITLTHYPTKIVQITYFKVFSLQTLLHTLVSGDRVSASVLSDYDLFKTGQSKFQTIHGNHSLVFGARL